VIREIRGQSEFGCGFAALGNPWWTTFLQLGCWRIWSLFLLSFLRTKKEAALSSGFREEFI
jgi:hypothetical protein